MKRMRIPRSKMKRLEQLEVSQKQFTEKIELIDSRMKAMGQNYWRDYNGCKAFVDLINEFNKRIDDEIKAIEGTELFEIYKDRLLSDASRAQELKKTAEYLFSETLSQEVRKLKASGTSPGIFN